jgi:hypothetical protein
MLMQETIRKFAFAAGMALLAPAALTAPASAADVTPAEAREIAKEAYIYGFPMVDNYRIAWAFFVDKGGPAYKTSINHLKSDANVFTPADKTVQTPNSDTPYSFTWLDLRAEPMVITLPPIEASRYYSVQLIDLYTFNFDYLGTRTTGNGGGNFLIAGPNWKGATPPGITKVIRAETQFVFPLYRTQLFGPSDIGNVKKIQAQYKLQPLSTFLGKPAPQAAPKIKFIPPLPAAKERSSLQMFNILSFVLALCPADPSEVDLRERFARIGIGPGQTIDFTTLSPAMTAALKAGMADGQKEIDARKAVTTSSVDLFGTRAFMKNDYVARALGAQTGIYGNSKDEAYYGIYDKPVDGVATSGAHNYTIHYAAGQFPPAKAFWSLTMYDLPHQFLVANPIKRYLINSPMLPELKLDADGGLTLYIQHGSPGPDKESNWLPAPQGPFMMIQRLYIPEPAVLDGSWTEPPLVTVK